MKIYCTEVERDLILSAGISPGLIDERDIEVIPFLDPDELGDFFVNMEEYS